MVAVIIAIIFGIVEGITEWLPISSTGHMILLNELIGIPGSDDFLEMFYVVIQLGAIFAVVFIYWDKIFPFKFKKGAPVIEKNIFSMWVKIAAACIPAAVVGIFFDDMIDEYFYNEITVAIALIIFGIAFILIERRNKNAKSSVNSVYDITYKQAMIIGFFQLIAAVFPGTSRSGATILAGIMIGLSRVVAAEFTFFMAIPVMFGASALKLISFGFSFEILELAMLIAGMVTAFIVSIVSIKTLVSYVKKHDFTIFGYYRIILGAVVIAFALL